MKCTFISRYYGRWTMNNEQWTMKMWKGLQMSEQAVFLFATPSPQKKLKLSLPEMMMSFSEMSAASFFITVVILILREQEHSYTTGARRGRLNRKKNLRGIILLFCAVTQGFSCDGAPISWVWSFSSLSNFSSDHENPITSQAPLRTTHLITSSTHNLLLRYFTRHLKTHW